MGDQLLLSRIEVTGYKRLVSASAYVGRKALALVGPNEAGKSSVLSALLLANDTEPVPTSVYSRMLRDTETEPSSDVVKLTFALTPDQEAIVRSLPLAVRPVAYVQHKRADGERRFSFYPFPQVDPKVSAAVLLSKERLEHLLGERTSFVAAEWTPEQEQLFEDLRAIHDDLQGKKRADEESWDRLRQVFGLSISESIPVDEALTEFETAYSWTRQGAKVSERIRDALGVEVPQFVLFDPTAHSVLPRYDLNNPATDDSVGLANLLKVAHVTLTQIRDNRDDRSYLKTLLERGTRRLENFFATRWSQERVSLSLDTDGSWLEVFVRDVDGGDSNDWLAFDERSDGLRTFVALATFLAQIPGGVPPVLLIDEVEQHLHLNAQADVVQMLVHLPQIQQVIYTTHSPGCLPPDIGSGVRFVEPRPDGSSVVRHDFWGLRASNHVGFNPLLFVMGAGAAAFSSLRYAVFVEGASDMLLLPTLIRLATREVSLPYQVAPGISVAAESDVTDMRADAGRVLFLVDGDPAGKKWAKELRSSSIPSSRIYALPAGVALEDLFERDFYLRVVAGFVGVEVRDLEELKEAAPIKPALVRWADARGLKLPGPVAVAEQLLGADESGDRPIVLSEIGRSALRDVHDWAMSQFSLA